MRSTDWVAIEDWRFIWGISCRPSHSTTAGSSTSILSILAGLLALTALKDRVLADQTHTFVIPADEGYGAGDCLGKDQTCAQVVAAAWCESHGLAGPLSYGRAEDMTGTVGTSPQPKIDPHAFIVTCKD